MTDKKEVTRKLEIDKDTADRITIINLRDYQSYLMEEMELYKEGDHYLHPDDVCLNIKTIAAIDLIAKQFEPPF